MTKLLRWIGWMSVLYGAIAVSGVLAGPEEPSEVMKSVGASTPFSIGLFILAFKFIIATVLFIASRQPEHEHAKGWLMVAVGVMALEVLASLVSFDPEIVIRSYDQYVQDFYIMAVADMIAALIVALAAFMAAQPRRRPNGITTR